MKYFDESIKLKHDFAGGWHNKATALYEMDNFKESLEMFERTIKFKSDDAEPFYNLSIVQ